MKIISIGIDQGIANCGYGCVEVEIDDLSLAIVSLKTLEYGVIVTKSDTPMSLRATNIVAKITSLVNDHNPQAMGCEKLFFSQPRQGGRNKSASMLYTNMATGLLYYIAGIAKLPLVELVPGTVKKLITGSGVATKEEMIAKISELLKIDKDDINNEHMADAVCIAIATAFYAIKNKEDFERAKDAVLIGKFKKEKKVKPIKEKIIKQKKEKKTIPEKESTVKAKNTKRKPKVA